MLVAGPVRSLRHNWSPKNTVAQPLRDSVPRMSNLEPVTAQPDWRDPYNQYLPPVENLPSLFEHVNSQQDDASVANQLYAPRPSLPHRHSLAQVDARGEPFLNSSTARSGSAPPTGNVGQSHLDDLGQKDAPEGSESILSESPTLEARTARSYKHEGQPSHGQLREDDEDCEEEDDEMLEAEERTGGGSRPPLTEAERRAERRKMKRFR